MSLESIRERYFPPARHIVFRQNSLSMVESRVAYAVLNGSRIVITPVSMDPLRSKVDVYPEIGEPMRFITTPRSPFNRKGMVLSTDPMVYTPMFESFGFLSKVEFKASMKLEYGSSLPMYLYLLAPVGE